MPQPQKISQTLLNVAWMAVLLGLGMEIVLVIVAALFGKSPQVNPVIADLVQKVSWSTLVCMGVAVGTAASRMRGVMMGLAGLIAAPAAFHIAKVLHKSVSQAMSVALPAAVGPSPLTLAILKAIEYAILGFILSKCGESLKAYVLSALGIGLVFGGIVLFLL
jgi:hypothetical protein